LLGFFLVRPRIVLSIEQNHGQERSMKRALLASVALVLTLGACADPGITPGFRDLPQPRGFSPSVKENTDASQAGQGLSPDQARQRAEYDVSSGQSSGNWPISPITYRSFTNSEDRVIYLRRALGRYALIEAQERGLGTDLNAVRQAARTSSSTTPAEWWARDVHGSDLLAGESARKVSLPETITATINSSHQIRAFGDLPAIRGTSIAEAKGRFTPEFFAQAQRYNEDVRATSPAIAVGDPRVRTDEDEVEFGVRSRLQTGGEVSLSQRFNRIDTNRTTYIPGEQTEARTVISLTQPLLRDGGLGHNDAPRRIANMDTQIATEEFRRQAETHLMEVERAYWNLYVARAVLVQKRNLASQGSSLAGQIQDRAGIDADATLVNRSRSLSAQWQADIVRAQSALDNAEFRLAGLVNDSRFGPGGVELVPSSAPNGALSALTTNDTLDQIFTHRPELQQAILQYEAALLREGMAANESLPELDLVLEAYADGGADGDAYRDAYDNSNRGDGNLIGLKFSVPLGFDERDARYKRRRLETIQQERQVMSVISSVLLEVDVAANEYVVAVSDLNAQRQALDAAQRDVDTLRQRWVGGADGGSIELLSVLLSSEQQVQSAEESVAIARATREIAAANLARARGVLLERWGLRTDIRRDIRNQPTYRLVRQ
jgi:outer membrane protein TolC